MALTIQYDGDDTTPGLDAYLTAVTAQGSGPWVMEIGYDDPNVGMVTVHVFVHKYEDSVLHTSPYSEFTPAPAEGTHPINIGTIYDIHYY